MMTSLSSRILRPRFLTATCYRCQRSASTPLEVGTATKEDRG